MEPGNKKLKIKRKLLSFLCMSTALFVFQACYGTDQDFGNDVLIKGIVKSSETNEPIPGIKVEVLSHGQYEYSDEEGRFEFWTFLDDQYNLRCTDIDSIENGSFIGKDTTLLSINDDTFVEFTLEEN